MRERVKNQIYNSVSVCSGVALQPDTTNHSPDVPTPHNSPAWNSTNPISAALVSTARPHSWACHRSQIRPLWLLCCIPVITPKNMLIPKDSSPPLGFIAALLCLHALKRSAGFQTSSHFQIDDRGAFSDLSSPPCLPHTSCSSTRWEDSETIAFMWCLTKGMLK